MEIRRILVPIDFSEHSERAFEEAIALAMTFKAELHCSLLSGLSCRCCGRILDVAIPRATNVPSGSPRPRISPVGARSRAPRESRPRSTSRRHPVARDHRAGRTVPRGSDRDGNPWPHRLPARGARQRRRADGPVRAVSGIDGEGGEGRTRMTWADYDRLCEDRGRRSLPSRRRARGGTMQESIGIEASFLASRSSASSKVDFSGHWRSQRGSSIQLAVDDQGRVSGAFRTAVGVPLRRQTFRCAASSRETLSRSA